MTISEMLEEFHKKHDIATQGFNDKDMWKLRSSLLKEECEEFAIASAIQDMVGMADALADVVYVAYGSAHKMGINLDACVEEVHRSNMTKDVGPTGKAIKGLLYNSPNIASVMYNSSPRDNNVE